MPTRETLRVTYRLAVEADRADARAEEVAREQTVEVPRAALRDRFVLEEVLGQVESVRPDAASGAARDDRLSRRHHRVRAGPADERDLRKFLAPRRHRVRRDRGAAVAAPRLARAALRDRGPAQARRRLGPPAHLHRREADGALAPGARRARLHVRVRGDRRDQGRSRARGAVLLSVRGARAALSRARSSARRARPGGARSTFRT